MYGGQRELPAEPTELAELARASDRDDREQALLDNRLQAERVSPKRSPVEDARREITRYRARSPANRAAAWKQASISMRGTHEVAPKGLRCCYGCLPIKESPPSRSKLSRCSEELHLWSSPYSSRAAEAQPPGPACRERAPFADAATGRRGPRYATQTGRDTPFVSVVVSREWQGQAEEVGRSVRGEAGEVVAVDLPAPRAASRDRAARQAAEAGRPAQEQAGEVGAADRLPPQAASRDRAARRALVGRPGKSLSESLCNRA